jgi:DNA repair protein RecN (Recombination protein N)
MLRTLRIEHLVLVDSCFLECEQGFHVITGETGAGKSILLTAIGLLLGEKADSSCVRQGEEKAIIEAEFEIPQTQEIFQILEEAEATTESNRITIRRELLCNGKSRAYINDQPIPIQILRKIAPLLIDISDQHSHLRLQSSSALLDILDTYAKTLPLRNSFEVAYQKYVELSAKLLDLQASIASRDVEIEALSKRIADIEDSHVLTVNEEELFQRFSLLQTQQETLQTCSSIMESLENGKSPIAHTLLRICQQLEKISSPEAKEALEQFDTAKSNIRNGVSCIHKLATTCEYEERELELLESQLSKIDKLHRMYGDTSNIQDTHAALKEKVKKYTTIETQIEDLQTALFSQKNQCDEIACTLREQRKTAARLLAPHIQQHLNLLNMTHATFEITVDPIERSSTGDDTVRFLITPNLGEKQIPISSASGGELSRIFLAIQTELADRYSVPTILFDEIDSGIGGMTAHAVGKVLAEMGSRRQVFAVTHLPQVAVHANIHFAICKSVNQQRTSTSVKRLTSKQELLAEQQRMAGHASS